ncbi:MAG: WD40/YVTN/BNR-like repeat-containing protein, partial [Candidatus Kapaibacterium sp.]
MKKSFTSFSFVLAIVMFAGLATAQKRTPAEARVPIEEDHAAEAAAWLAHFINPMGEANYDSLQQAGYEQFIRMDNRPAMKVTSSAAWVEVAKSQEGRVSGRPSGIDFDPNGAIYLATTNGGLWKSMNNGQNWSSLSGTWKTLDVGGVAVDPENPNTVYAGTGIYLSTLGGGANISGVGVYKSTDGGLNWTLIDSVLGPVDGLS